MNESRKKAWEDFLNEKHLTRVSEYLPWYLFHRGYDAGQRDTNESMTRQLSTAKAALEYIKLHAGPDHIDEPHLEAVATKALEDIKNGNS